MTEYPARNMLGDALSPYLLQHRDNPVHWRQWGPEALAEASDTGKPILLSVGYAACHWCHVMAHESFENPEIAAVMNRLFVNVKVDREERPDVDQLYMAALHAFGEQGGWPLTMFLTPAGEPFWGGTYFPPEQRYGRPGFPQVLNSVRQAYDTQPDRVSGNAEAVKRHLSGALASAGTPSEPQPEMLDQVSGTVQNNIDPRHGGIGAAPKFPNASMFEAVFRHYRRTNDDISLKTIIHWMRALCQGGIYDHLGGGLHRYTVDERWLVPHFEKMLYDNAQFIRGLVWIHGLTNEPLFRNRIEQTIDFLLRELRLEGGGFASSLDADSEGEEGRFYVWSLEEIREILGTESDDFCRAYDVTAGGNWEGKTILNRLGTVDANDDDPALAKAKETLLRHRANRVRPALDDKVLADWNGLTIRALAEAGAALNRRDWIDTAIAAFNFVSESMSRNGRLAHTWRNGTATFPGLLSDHASMANAAISLFAATAEDRYSSAAQEWMEIVESDYSNGAGGYFLTTARDDLILRAYNDQDEATPSATAQTIEALARLSAISNNPEIHERALLATRSAWGRIANRALGCASSVNAIETAMEPKKLVIAHSDTAMLDATRRQPDPGRIDIVTNETISAARITGTSEAADSKRPSAWLCHGMACLPPVHDATALIALLSPGGD